MKAAVRVLAVLFLSLLALGWAPVRAQNDSDKPMRLIVGYVPGGAVDALARQFGQAIGDLLRQQVIVENRPGASGNIARDFVAKSPADGHTLLFAPSTLIANPLVTKAQSSFDLERDLTPIAMIASGPLLMLVPMDGPATVREFVAGAKAHPEKYNFGTGGFGAAGHLSAEFFKQKAGIDNVPTVLYKGTAAALTDLIGGRLSAMMEPTLSGMPFVNGGKLRALAITSKQRDPLFPNVPTFAEVGFPDMEFATWYGVWGPANLPPPVTRKLIEAQATVLRSAAFQGWLRQQGYEGSTLSGADFSAFLRNESQRYARIVKDGNIQPQ